MSTPIVSYEDACGYLDGLQMHKIKLGLEAMRATLAALGSPEKRCPAVHVAGTNGKGSVCSMLQAVMSAAGYRTGLYTSPHLNSVRERLRIDGDHIGRDDFTRLMETIRCSLGETRITYFECTTALAFLWFAENGCDLVVLETGMGGRLDATNVVVPLLSVITTVSMDHEQYLGTSIEEVAFEKAGIVKDDVPVISGVDDEQAQRVIAEVCGERRAPLLLRKRDFWMERGPRGAWEWRSAAGAVALNLLPATQPNRWQIDNISCAVAAAVQLRSSGFDIANATIDRAIAGCRWPGRMEVIETTRRFLLDGAHNQAGVDCLIESLGNFPRQRLLVVWASMGDKNYEKMLNDIAGVADLLILTRPDSERAARPEELYARLHQHQERAVICADVESACRLAVEKADPGDLILVAGSLYLIGEFRALLAGEVAR